MPRCSRSLPVPLCDVPRTSPTLALLREQAAQLLTQAHQLLATIDEEIQTLDRCLEVLAHAPAEHFFFYRPEPPTLISAVGRKAGTYAAATLHARLTLTRHHACERVETIRLNTLLTLSHLGLPVALWHLLIPGPLPQTIEVLAPTGARGAVQTDYPPPCTPHALSLSVTRID